MPKRSRFSYSDDWGREQDGISPTAKWVIGIIIGGIASAATGFLLDRLSSKPQNVAADQGQKAASVAQLPPSDRGPSGAGVPPKLATHPTPKVQGPWPGGVPSGRPDLPEGWKLTKAVAGPGFAKAEFREYRQDGSLLVGFELGAGKNLFGDILAFHRPIWRTPAGVEEVGAAYGPYPGPEKISVVKAKPGYAIGGALVVGGFNIDGMCFTFMKVGPKYLDPLDSYVSDWYGRQSIKPAADAMRTGDGSRVVGIHGLLFAPEPGAQNGAIGSLGFVLGPSKQ